MEPIEHVLLLLNPKIPMNQNQRGLDTKEQLTQLVGKIIMPVIDSIQFLYKGNPMLGSASWITYWQQAMSDLISGDESEQAITMNDNLALRFHLLTDSRLMPQSDSVDCSMPKLIQSAIDSMCQTWSASWIWESVDYGESIVTLSNLLGCAIDQEHRDAGICAFGISIDDKNAGSFLIGGLANDEPVMDEHLRKQIMNLIEIQLLIEQIERAPKR